MGEGVRERERLRKMSERVIKTKRKRERGRVCVRERAREAEREGASERE